MQCRILGPEKGNLNPRPLANAAAQDRRQLRYGLQGKLRRRQPHHPIHDRRPLECTVLQPFPEKHQSRAIPSKDLHSVRPLRAKYKNCPREGILLERLLHQRGKMERGVLVQRSMAPRFIIVGSIRAQNPARVIASDQPCRVGPRDRRDRRI